MPDLGLSGGKAGALRCLVSSLDGRARPLVCVEPMVISLGLFGFFFVHCFLFPEARQSIKFPCSKAQITLVTGLLKTFLVLAQSWRTIMRATMQTSFSSSNTCIRNQALHFNPVCCCCLVFSPKAGDLTAVVMFINRMWLKQQVLFTLKEEIFLSWECKCHRSLKYYMV